MERLALSKEQIRARVNDAAFRSEVKNKSGAAAVVPDYVNDRLIIVIADMSDDMRKGLDVITDGVPYVMKPSAYKSEEQKAAEEPQRKRRWLRDNLSE